jgi:hypothetical protein
MMDQEFKIEIEIGERGLEYLLQGCCRAAVCFLLCSPTLATSRPAARAWRATRRSGSQPVQGSRHVAMTPLRRAAAVAHRPLAPLGARRCSAMSTRSDPRLPVWEGARAGCEGLMGREGHLRLRRRSRSPCRHLAPPLPSPGRAVAAFPE